MTNVTILQNNKMQNISAVFPARQGGWQTYEMCSILPDCKRWAQFDAFIQYMHYTNHYDICNICANMTYMLHIHSAITLTKKICQESLKLSSNSNCSSLALRLASQGTFWWFQNACTIFTIPPPPICIGRPISFMVLVNCESIASQSINRADTRSHLTAPD